MVGCWEKSYNKGNDYESVKNIEKRYNIFEITKYSATVRCLKWSFIVLLSLLFLSFIALYVILPLIFMKSIGFQRLLMFPNYDEPENPQFENYAIYGAEGVFNRYINVQDVLNISAVISLGVWQVVPESRINASKSSDFNYYEELRNSKEPICIYFHGNSGTRIFAYPTYQKLRKLFHVLAVDYRSYGDSSVGLLTEEAVVYDLQQFYYKILEMTDQKEIYFWGHSLGSALCSHALKKLTEAQITQTRNVTLPRGLILEAPFSTMREEIPNHRWGRPFAWLPWLKVTILDPLEANGFHFWTTTNILSVNCPIMILHAKEDNVVPSILGEKVAAVAKNDRDTDKQGPVIMHLIPEEFHCGHREIYTHPYLEQFISDFMNTTKYWNQLSIN